MRASTETVTYATRWMFNSETGQIVITEGARAQRAGIYSPGPKVKIKTITETKDADLYYRPTRIQITSSTSISKEALAAWWRKDVLKITADKDTPDVANAISPKPRLLPIDEEGLRIRPSAVVFQKNSVSVK